MAASVKSGAVATTNVSFRVGNSPGNITIGGLATFGDNTNLTSKIIVKRSTWGCHKDERGVGW